MEQNQDNSLFNLSVDTVSKAHLKETAGWAKFLAIVGMIMCVLMAIGGFVFAFYLSKSMAEFDDGFRSYRNSADSTAMGVTMGITYLLFAVIYFFPCLFTLRFANHTKNAINANDQVSLNEGLKNLKVTFRYMGILTVIALAFIIIAFLLGGFAAIMTM